MYIVRVTVKIQFDNTSAFKYSIRLALSSVPMLLHAPLIKHSGSAPDYSKRLYKPVSDWLEMLPLDSTGLNM